jgi:spore germination protein GerM
MNRKIAGWVVGVALLVIAGAIAWWMFGKNNRGVVRSSSEPAAQTEPGEKRSFDLYFPADEESLRAERRDLVVGDDPKDRIHQLVAALLDGPKAAGLVRLFPEGVVLASVQLAADGTAYVDLHWADHADPPAAGSSEEIQRVYGLVNTITLNVPQATHVVILWNGTQRLTFAGHLDTSVPLAADRTLLAH